MNMTLTERVIAWFAAGAEYREHRKRDDPLAGVPYHVATQADQRYQWDQLAEDLIALGNDEPCELGADEMRDQ